MPMRARPWSSIKSDARVYYPRRMGTASSGCLLLLLLLRCCCCCCSILIPLLWAQPHEEIPLPQRLATP